MTETLDNMNAGTPERPTFLTVLCILTFIGSGLGVLGSLMGFMGSAALSYFSPQGSMIGQVIGLVASGLCLFGAIKMWGLYKQGFTFYVLGVILAIIGSIVSVFVVTSVVNSAVSEFGDIEGVDAQVGNAVGALAGAFAWTGVVFSIIINGLFVLLYNMNRKHLVK